MVAKILSDKKLLIPRSWKSLTTDAFYIPTAFSVQHSIIIGTYTLLYKFAVNVSNNEMPGVLRRYESFPQTNIHSYLEVARITEQLLSTSFISTSLSFRGPFVSVRVSILSIKRNENVCLLPLERGDYNGWRCLKCVIKHMYPFYLRNNSIFICFCCNSWCLSYSILSTCFITAKIIGLWEIQKKYCYFFVN